MTIRTALLAAGVAAFFAVPAISQTTTPSSPANPTPSAPGATPMPAPGATPAPGTNMINPTTGSTGTTGMSANTTAGGMWYTAQIGPNQHRASDLINQSVYNRANERVGEVNELVLDQSGQVVAAIIGVGGFLGIGERNVAVNFNQLQMTNENNKMRLMVNADKAQLQQAPEFSRPETWRRM